MARHRSPRPASAPSSSRSGAPITRPRLAAAPAAGVPVGSFRVGLTAPAAASVPVHPLEPSAAGPAAALPPTPPTPPAAPTPSRPRPASRRPAGPATSGLLRSRLAVAAVAAGALATAGHSVAVAGLPPAGTDTGTETAALALRAAVSGLPTAAAPPDAPRNAPAATPSRSAPGAATGVDDAATTGVLPVTSTAAARPATSAAVSAASDQVGSLSKSRRIADESAAKEAAAAAPEFVRPASGTFTSGFGARWGTSHLGIDIANAIGTPIVSAGDGTVIESGPASGFGMWVRVRLEDGTMNVYGHINRSLVSAGDTVRAGQEIAEIGNRGQSTGPHLHFEVWTPAGKKINPLPWLAERGIDVGGSAGGGGSD